MVTRSPRRASVISIAFEDGCSRTGATGSTTSHSSPVPKRVAATLPARYSAARSPGAGVSRGSYFGSCIALAQQGVDGACGLALAAFGACGLGRRRPAVDVDMQPAPGLLDEALQEQRAGDRAGKAA